MKNGAVLITGGAKRIGREIALSFGKKGFAVAVHYGTSKKEAEAVAREIEQAGGRAVVVQADLTDYEQTRELVSKGIAAIGQPLTVLVNNAAVFMGNSVQDFTDEEWRTSLDTNLKAPAMLSQAFARDLPEANEGAIINIIDQRVLSLNTDYLTYTLSKHALWCLTKILAVELAPSIRVNGIAPGPTLANIFQSKKDFENEVQATPLQRGPELSEISAAVNFLLDTPSITGHMITLDGGQHLV